MRWLWMLWMAAITLACAVARGAGAQDAAARSTLDSVYTAEQATRGRDVYVMMCKSCHTPASHTGDTFAKFWKGQAVSDLFGFIREKMPKNDPGSLSPEESADLVAYLLKMNAMPDGPTELPPDSAALALIRIEMQPTKRPAVKPTVKKSTATRPPARRPTKPD